MKRFWSKVEAQLPGPPSARVCWEWQAAKCPEGYGRFRFNGKTEQAHRVAYFLHWGRWPAVVRHTCDNPGCVNPLHLSGGTHADNVQDRVDRGREGHLTGEAHPHTHLSTADVQSIRARFDAGESITLIALDLNTPRRTVGNIAHRKRRIHE